MLWILLGIFVICFIFIFTTCKRRATDILFDCGAFSVVTFIITLTVFSFYYSTKNTTISQIEVLEQNNIEIMESIVPLVNKYLNYESSTFENFKYNANNIISLSMFPELKGNEFVMMQINLVIKNNEEIKNLKLQYAKLDDYKPWIFMGKD